MKKYLLLFIVLINGLGAYTQTVLIISGANTGPSFNAGYNVPRHFSETTDSVTFDNTSIYLGKKLPLNIPNDLEGPYALVAGGSKGIGYAIAAALARRGYNLILIARHLDSLMVAKRTLESTYPIHVEVLVYDLSKEEAAGAIAKWCTDKNIHLKMLCNVAGLGGTKDYLSLPLDTLRYMVRLNIESTMALTLTLLPLLEKNAPSYILNVGSMAGYAPIPVKNLYSATKSAVLYFSYALRYQLKAKHISVSCLTPGPVFTKPSIEKDTRERLGWLGMKMAVSPERVGEIAVRETLNKRLIIVPGSIAKIATAIIRFLPRRWVVAFYGTVGD
ncbi:MAG: SDR family NAD(P)-dependent oxidoreductase [Ferruginibacter sp.]